VPNVLMEKEATMAMITTISIEFQKTVTPDQGGGLCPCEEIQIKL
jgi:hypothetical protein